MVAKLREVETKWSRPTRPSYLRSRKELMQNVSIPKERLQERVQLNRDNHRSKFEEAQKSYQSFLISELEKRLDEARRGIRVDRVISLPEPQDHTKDYDQILTMLDMTEDDTISLTHKEFRSYVMDEWGWIPEFGSTFSAYTGKEYTNTLGEVVSSPGQNPIPTGY